MRSVVICSLVLAFGAAPALAQQSGGPAISKTPIAPQQPGTPAGQSSSSATPTGLAPATPGQAQGPRPGGSMEICLIDYRFQIGDVRHSVSGFAKSKDGKALSYAVDSQGMNILQSADGRSATPIVLPNGFAAGSEPELINYLERANADRAWLTIGFDAAARPGNTIQKVTYVFRAPASAGARCG